MGAPNVKRLLQEYGLSVDVTSIISAEEFEDAINLADTFDQLLTLLQINRYHYTRLKSAYKVNTPKW